MNKKIVIISLAFIVLGLVILSIILKQSQYQPLDGWNKNTINNINVWLPQSYNIIKDINDIPVKYRSITKDINPDYTTIINYENSDVIVIANEKYSNYASHEYAINISKQIRDINNLNEKDFSGYRPPNKDNYMFYAVGLKDNFEKSNSIFNEIYNSLN